MKRLIGGVLVAVSVFGAIGGGHARATDLAEVGAIHDVVSSLTSATHETTGTPGVPASDRTADGLSRPASRRRPRQADHERDDAASVVENAESATAHRYSSVERVPLSDLPADVALAWDRQVRDAHNLYAMYQSSDWMSCALARTTQKQMVLLRKDCDGISASSITPVSYGSVPLRFQLGRWRLDLRFESVEVLGSQPLGAATYGEYLGLVDAIWRDHPSVQAIYFKSVPNDSDLWGILQTHRWRLGETVAYRPEGERPFHYVALPSTFDGYLGEFRKKRRYNLKRQVRVLSEAFSDSLTVKRITEPDEVPALLQSVREVAANSWKAAELTDAVPEAQFEAETLAEVAANGLLRCYVLSVDAKPCAYVVGYQFNGIYHYANIGYDTRLSEYSPGNVLLLLVIQDLIEDAGAKHVNFGVTDAEYKRVFGNRHIHDAAVLMLRPGLANDAKRGLHMGFCAVKSVARDLVQAARAFDAPAACRSAKERLARVFSDRRFQSPELARADEPDI